MIENILSIVIMSVLIVWVITDIILDRAEKRAYLICAILLIGVVIAEMCCLVYENTIPDNRIKSLIGNIVGFSLAPFVFTIESCIYDKKHTYIRFIPAIVILPIVLISSYTGWIFQVNENNIYSRGPLYYLYMIVFVYSFLISILSKFKAIGFLPGFFKIRLILHCVVLLAGMSVQLIFPHVHSTWIMICLFFVLDYAIIFEIKSMVDSLTGLLNKSVFNRQMNTFQATKNSNYYIIMLDVNDFKKVNDTRGHLYGDKCLCEIASVLKGLFRRHANIFRFGGDEFCVLLKAKSDTVLDQHIETLKRDFLKCKDKMEDFPDVAVGYAKFEINMLPRETIDAADSNMYARKKEMKENQF